MPWTTEAEPETEQQTTEEEIEADCSSYSTTIIGATTVAVTEGPGQVPSVSSVEASTAHAERIQTRHSGIQLPVVLHSPDITLNRQLPINHQISPD